MSLRTIRKVSPAAEFTLYAWRTRAFKLFGEKIKGEICSSKKHEIKHPEIMFTWILAAHQHCRNLEITPSHHEAEMILDKRKILLN